MELYTEEELREKIQPGTFFVKPEHNGTFAKTDYISVVGTSSYGIYAEFLPEARKAVISWKGLATCPINLDITLEQARGLRYAGHS